MRPLPLSLWLLVAAQIEALEQTQAGSQSGQHLPTAVRKMPPDDGAKFHHEYCAFADHASMMPSAHQIQPAIAARSAHEADDSHRIWANASAELPIRPPFALLSAPEHEERTPPHPWDLFRRAASALAFLEKRQWSCPSGTSSCSSIGFPNSCCGEGETCMEVPDTGLGPVGCCPSGATCGGGISDCADGSTGCASEIGGGCCIPGFVCEGVGCVRSPSPTPTLTTLTTTSTSIISLPTPSTILVTVIITITPSTSPTAITSTVTRTSTASLSSSSTSSTGGAGAPYRPTSSASSDRDTTTQPDTNPSYCPTGFYPCLARAGGGCCQTGRDCATTSCPPQQTPMTTIVNGNGVTVVVPATDLPETTTGRCASGWFLCGDEGGSVAGCCPTGYECGTASCLAGFTASGGGEATASVAKVLPGENRGGRVRVRLGWVVGAVVVGGLFGLM